MAVVRELEAVLGGAGLANGLVWRWLKWKGLEVGEVEAIKE